MYVPPQKQVYQFKITLQDIKPPIWRRIQVPSTYTFWDLHVAIQDAMGWLDYHLHEFHIKDIGGKKLFIGIPSEDDDFMDDFIQSHKVLPGWKHKVSTLISTTHPTFLYVYDFGDDWYHTIKLEKVLPHEDGISYPRCIGGKSHSPPEDCGGPPGYQNLLEVLANPEDTEYKSTREWVDSMKDGTFDPEKFKASDVVFDDPKERFKRAFREE
jgi:hypothetical protein